MPKNGLATQSTAIKERLHTAIAERTARIVTLGLGYVGLPLAVKLADHFSVVGLDIDANRVNDINNGKSYIGDIESTQVAALAQSGRLRATMDYAVLSSCDCIIICVPNPLAAGERPDMSHIMNAGEEIAKHLQRGQLIILESTTYPGATDENFSFHSARLCPQYRLSVSSFSGTDRPRQSRLHVDGITARARSRTNADSATDLFRMIFSSKRLRKSSCFTAVSPFQTKLDPWQHTSSAFDQQTIFDPPLMQIIPFGRYVITNHYIAFAVLIIETSIFAYFLIVHTFYLGTAVTRRPLRGSPDQPSWNVRAFRVMS